MKRWDFTLPELEQKLDALAEGALHQITRRDYERLFGTNSAALGRLRNFAKSHASVASFADNAILFRRRLQPRPKQGPDISRNHSQKPAPTAGLGTDSSTTHESKD
jgi:hypothetical protein